MANPLTDVFGDTPEVAPYIKTILGDEQIKALVANLKAMPDISQLGGRYYDYMMGMMERSIPGFADILSTGGTLTKKMESVAGQELAGQIPQDVVDQVQRTSAFQNLLSGAGGGMANANTARNLGLTSLDMISKGSEMATQAGNAAQRWSGLASGLIMNPASFFISPQEQAAMTMQNNLYKQATQQLRNNLSAAPDPVAKGVSDTVINLLGKYLGSLGGGGMGGVGGAGGAAGGDATAGNVSQFGGALGTASNWLGGGGNWAGQGNLLQRMGSGGGGRGGGGGGGGQTAPNTFADLGFGNAFVPAQPNLIGGNFGQPYAGSSIDPYAFGAGQFQPDPTLNIMNPDPFNFGITSGMSDYGTPSSGTTDINSLLNLSPTGNTAFAGTGSSLFGNQGSPDIWGGIL